MMKKSRVLATALAITASGITAAGAGPAINQFEVKDLQSEPGDFEFQSQNAWSSGQPRRKSVETSPGEFAYDDNAVTRQREALELQLGITDWFRVRVGVEYEQERLDEPGALSQANTFGSLKLDEVALEGVIVFIKPKKEGIGLGLLMEYGAPVNAPEEAAEFYIGPILEAHIGSWTLIANLMFVKFIGGGEADEDGGIVKDEKWDFSYFTQFHYEISRNWALALEAYGTIDRLCGTGHQSEAAALFGDHNQHRAGPVVYYTFFPFESPLPKARARRPAGSMTGEDDDDDEKQWSVSVGSGVLFGLNENTPDLTYKLSLEVDY